MGDSNRGTTILEILLLASNLEHSIGRSNLIPAAYPVSMMTNTMEPIKVRVLQPPLRTPPRSSVKGIFSIFDKTWRTVEALSRRSSRKSFPTSSIAKSEVFSAAAAFASESPYEPIINLLTSQNNQLRSRCHELRITADANKIILDQCIANMEAKETHMKEEMAALREIIKALSIELTSANEPNQKLETEHEQIVRRMEQNIETLTSQRAQLQTELEMKSAHVLRLEAWGCQLEPDGHSRHPNDRAEHEMQLVKIQDEAKSMQVQLESLTSSGRSTDDIGDLKAIQDRLNDISEKLANFQKVA